VDIFISFVPNNIHNCRKITPSSLIWFSFIPNFLSSSHSSSTSLTFIFILFSFILTDSIFLYKPPKTQTHGNIPLDPSLSPSNILIYPLSIYGFCTPLFNNSGNFRIYCFLYCNLAYTKRFLLNFLNLICSSLV
jgi:hypothetical protein